ncbi:MAG: hypothetical protein LRY27_02335 [Chitinophagales bacterium]|nr:hypothetical protein [Chitinophagales bacterium]
MKNIGYFMVILLLVASCTKEVETEYVEGLKPIYSEQVYSKDIVSQMPKTITQGSKIYIKDNYVCIVEKGLGVHFIDNSNSSSPSALRFIKIDGITDVAIKQNTLYANQENDIVAINITDLMAIDETARFADVYEVDVNQFPVGYNGYFECVDGSKGIVVSWEEAVLENPKCFR